MCRKWQKAVLSTLVNIYKVTPQFQISISKYFRNIQLLHILLYIPLCHFSAEVNIWIMKSLKTAPAPASR